MAKPVVTQADVARRAGVGQSTVSRILRGVDRADAATRAAVERAAAELGYVPDPALASLATRRHGHLGKSTRSRVLVVEASGSKGKCFYGAELVDALSEQTQALGLACEYHALPASKFSAVLPNILSSQRCEGLLLMGNNHAKNLPEAVVAKLISKRVATLAVDAFLPKLAVSRVTIDHAAAIDLCLQELRQTGHRRIGLCLHLKTDYGSRQQWLAGFARDCLARDPTKRLSDWWWPANPPPGSTAYFQERIQRLDHHWREHGWQAIISRHSLRNFAQHAGLELGQDLSYVNLGLRDGSSTSGILADRKRLLVHAVEMLESMIRHRQLGLGQEATTVSLTPRWNPGNTIRQLSGQ